MRSPESPSSIRLRPDEAPALEYTRRLGEDAGGIDEIGGKAAGLVRLAGAGMRVPDGFVITARAFREAVDRLVASVDSLAELAEALRAAELPPEVTDEVSASLVALGEPVVAVRSSAVGEDAAEHSFAGQHVTVLGVDGLEAVLDAVREVWAGALAEHALAYRVRMAVDTVPAGVAVVVQRMIAPDCAGVAFTVDPTAPGSREAVICAAAGLGTAVVGGEACDTYYVERPSGYLTRSDLHEDVLGPQELRDLTKWIEQAERAFGGPLDLEWARVDGAFVFLQARPVTSPSNGAVAESVWTNSNVGEALPGVATPLTWSVIRRFSRRGFERAFGTLGLDVPDEYELVGSFAGRVYLNLTQFAEVTSHIPILSPDTLFEMAGGGGVELVRHLYEERDTTGFLLRLPATIPRVLASQLGMPVLAPLWDALFRAWCEAFFTNDLELLDHEAFGAQLDRLDAMFDWNGEFMLAGASNFLMSYVATRETLRAIGHAEIHGREQALLGGLHVSSADPGLELLELGRIARRSRRLRRLILETAPEATLDALRDNAAHSDVALFLEEFDRFRRAFGHRAPREAELATPRWREEPKFLFEVLRGFLDAKHLPSRTEVDRDREKARREVDRIIDDALSPGLGRVFHALLDFTRAAARRREMLRNRVVDSLDMYRRYFLEAGRRMASRGALAIDEDVFFLTVEEVRHWLADARSGRDFRYRVLVRRALYDAFGARPELPNIFVLRGSEIIAEESYSERERALAGDVRELRGLPASPGRVTGRARVMRDPADAALLQSGEVLVVPYADVGWTPMFLSASAIVMDLGGPLSHASIVAREYGVPAVVNTRTALQSIQTGDLVTVDGARGIVFIRVE